jgi:hypothetical protein
LDPDFVAARADVFGDAALINSSLRLSIKNHGDHGDHGGKRGKGFMEERFST